jgi:adenylate cyclase
VEEVVSAATCAITVLEHELPLRARAGLACGPVVRRAGDYFGTVVNLAQRLTAAAEPGSVLAAEPAVSAVDGTRVRDHRLLEVRGIAKPVAVAVVA